MYELLKNIAADNDFEFLYARKDFTNLFNEIEETDKPHLFLDPVQTSTTFDEYNAEDYKTYSGSFMVLLSSHLDEENYDERYQSYIKPLAIDAIQIIKDTIKCDGDYTIQVWQEVEIINAFDYNFDGLIITYTIIE